MQRTEYLAILHHTGTKRPTPMRALVVNAVKLPIEIPEGEFMSVNMDRASVSRRNTFRVGSRKEVAHASEAGLPGASG